MPLVSMQDMPHTCWEFGCQIMMKLCIQGKGNVQDTLHAIPFLLVSIENRLDMP